jgi:hypothetical protein
MAIRSSDLGPREWDALKRIQNRAPILAADEGTIAKLKELGLVEEKAGGGLTLSKTANRVLAGGRQR